MSELTHVKGLADLQKLLNTLPVKIERNIMRGALRAGMKVVREEALNGVPVASGYLKDGMKISTRARGGKVTASLKATGKHGFLAHFIEYGTNPHIISGKEGSPLKVGENYFDLIDHPGQQAKPFMRPALDKESRAAVTAAGEYIKKRLARKHGLDTAHIEIEGGE